MDRLKHRRAGACRVEVRRRGEADASRHGAAEVGEDVAEEVVGDDDVVALRVLHEVDAGGVDVVVGGLDIGVVGGHPVEGPLPEVAREREHVGLVDERQVVPATPSQFEGEADAALHAHTRVDRALGGDLVRRALAQEATLAGIGALGVLTDNTEVDVLPGEHEGSEVDVEVEGEAHLEQQAAFDDPRRDVGGADRAHVEGVERTPFLDDLVGEDGAVAKVAVTAKVVVHDLELDARSRDDLEALGDDLGADAVASHDADAIGHV